MTQKELLNIQQLARYLNLKQSNLRRKILRREIPYLKIGHLIRFEIDQINEWLKSNTQNGVKHD